MVLRRNGRRPIRSHYEDSSIRLVVYQHFEIVPQAGWPIILVSRKFTTARVTQVGQCQVARAVCLPSQPSKSVSIKLSNESHDKSVAIEDGFCYKTKFMDFIVARLLKTRNVDETLCNEHPGHLVTKHQSLVTRDGRWGRRFGDVTDDEEPERSQPKQDSPTT
ncbi:hypothetical protein AVEN_176655-1 [Araneus ventricosus]|uniref:Uncharacterized protein n=1 Tax=Araneus ventricosus TaxID=182803 RepID=A0A4Y2WC41_ARAVE|nr:hypothetical protein AVEN_176655-1 [Araneus ventricosus]